MIELNQFLILSALLFSIGVIGIFLNRKKCNYNFNVD